MNWEPIETAPKDGTYVLVWKKYNEAPVVAALYPSGWSVLAENLEVACGVWCEGGSIRTETDFNPTHWMPLPENPTE